MGHYQESIRVSKLFHLAGKVYIFLVSQFNGAVTASASNSAAKK